LPRFYLNVINTAEDSDKEAFDLASLEEAKTQETAGARDLISDKSVLDCQCTKFIELK